MKQKNTVIFTAVISAIFILTIAVYICSLSVEFNKGKVASQERFTTITHDVATGIKSNIPGTQAFSDALVSSIGSVSDLAFIQVKSGDTIYFSYPADIGDTSDVTSTFVRAFSTTISAGDGSLCTLTAALYLLKPSSIFYKGRIAFLVILAATIAAIIYLIILIKKDASAEPLNTAAEATTADEVPVPSFEPEPILGAEPPSAPAEPPEEPLAAETGEAAAAAPAEQAAPEAEATPATEGNNAPNGLFSPITGFGWESYMTTRLDSELSRAASSEQDLALFTIRIPCLDPSCAAAKEIYSLIINTFKFKDLVFEYKEDGCSAIMQNVNIDQALVIADNLHIAITSILAKAGLDSVAAIGISSRSLRLISGARLASESEQALIHAFEDKESPVIAFRVNPDKYRSYLASEAASLPSEA